MPDGLHAVFLAGASPEGTGVALAVVAAAAAGAAVAGLTRLPKPVGYLAAGILIGPGGLGLVGDRDQIVMAAEIGVALLLFSVGLELSLRELARNLRRAMVVGLGQAIAVGVAVYVGAIVAGAPGLVALILAGAGGLSSTAAGVALLSEPSGRVTSLSTVTVGVLIVQDILAVVIIASVPALTAGDADVLLVALLDVGAALAAILAVVPIAAGVSRLAMRALARRVDRELFLVATLAAVGGSAAGASLLGLSPALGAFLAGLLIRQSGYGRQALLETVSLRDVFAAIFFVSVGLLFRPEVATEEPGLLLVMLGGVLVLKLAALTVLARYTGLPWGAALTLGMVLANAGEFAFVVGDAADPSVLAEEYVSVLVFTVVVSVLISSVLAGAADWSTRLRSRIPEGALAVVGYGRVGRALAAELAKDGPLVVLDRSAGSAALARADGLAVVWGDILQPGVARRLNRPRAIIVTPAGPAGVEIVEALATVSMPRTKIVSLATPPRPGALGLDLAVVDVDRRLAADVREVLADSLAQPFESPVLRTRSGVVRYDFPGRRARRPRGSVLLRLVSWLGPQPGECGECSGRGRHYSWPVATTCRSCGGTGRAT